jgi:hypothetical protein
MSLGMSEHHAIRVVRAQGDRVHPLQLVGIALGGSLLGLGLMSAWANLQTAQSKPNLNRGAEERSSSAASPAMRDDAADDTKSATPRVQLLMHEPNPETGDDPAEADQPDAVVATSAFRSDPPIHAAQAIGAATLEHSEDAATAQPSASSSALKVAPSRLAVTGKAPTRQFVQVVVAYLRCDGLERQKRRFPCPRDRRFEANVWSTLQELTRCKNVDPGVGQAELRLTLHGRQPLTFEFAAPPNGRSLNLRAVSQCTSRRLPKLRARLRTEHGLVTFRFGLS